MASAGARFFCKSAPALPHSQARKAENVFLFFYRCCACILYFFFSCNWALELTDGIMNPESSVNTANNKKIVIVKESHQMICSERKPWRGWKNVNKGSILIWAQVWKQISLLTTKVSCCFFKGDGASLSVVFSKWPESE